MPPLDVAQVGAEVIASVRGFTERAVAPVREKLVGVEERVAALPSADFVRAEIASASSKLMLDLLATFSRSSDGKTLTVEDVTPLVETLVAALPVPKDGANGRDGANGVDGTSISPDQMQAMVADTVARQLAGAQEFEARELADAIVLRFTAAALA